MLWFGKKKEGEQANVASPAAPSAPEATAASAPVPSTPKTQESAIPPPVARPAPAAAADVGSRNQGNPKIFYYGLMNALYDAVLVMDDNGHLMDCNERVEDIFGYSRDDVWDLPIVKLLPAVNARILAQMKEGLHGNRRVLINARCLRKDGTSFHGEVGAGLMELRGEKLVLTIRNIEKRSPAKAIIRPANVVKTAE